MIRLQNMKIYYIRYGKIKILQLLLGPGFQKKGSYIL